MGPMRSTNARADGTHAPKADRALVWGRLEITLGVALTAVLVAARVVAYDHAGGLWRDEVDSVNLASDPAYGETWMRAWFPALFSEVLHRWVSLGFGESDASLRSYGLLCGFLHVAAAWWTGRQFGARVPWALLVGLAFNPAMIVYGGSVRPWGLGVLTQLIMVGCVWRVVTSPSRPRIALLSIAALVAVQATYNNSVMLASACAGAGLVCLRRRDVGTILVLIAIGLVSALTVLPFFLNAIDPTNDWANVLRQEQPWSRHIAVLVEAVGQAGPSMYLVWPAAALGSVGVACVVLRKPRTAVDDPATIDRALFLLGNAVVGTVGFWIYIRLTGLQTEVWYYLPFIALVAVTVEIGLRIASDLRPRLEPIMAVAALAIFACAWGPTWPALAFRFTNIDLLVKPLAEQANENDLVVVFPWYAGLTFGRYYHGRAPSMNFPDVEKERHSHRGYRDMKRKMTLNEPIGAELARFERTLRGGGRIWLVGGLRFLPPGVAPVKLPPAPHPVYGWSHSAYESSWSQQAAFLLQTHANSIRRIPVNCPARVNPHEDLALFVVEGWRGAAGPK